MDKGRLEQLVNAAKLMEGHFKAFKDIKGIVDFISQANQTNQELEDRKDVLTKELTLILEQKDALPKIIIKAKDDLENSLTARRNQIDTEFVKLSSQLKIEIEKLEYRISGLKQAEIVAEASYNSKLVEIQSRSKILDTEILSKENIIKTLGQTIKKIVSGYDATVNS